MMQALARRGFPVEVLCGTMLDLREDRDPDRWIAERFGDVDQGGGQSWDFDARGIRAETPDSRRLTLRGVPVTIHRGPPTTRTRTPDKHEGREFLRLFDRFLTRFRPEVVVGYGGSWVASEIYAKAHAAGVATVFFLHNFQYHNSEAFGNIDRVCVPSRFAADYYRSALGMDCTVLPNLIDRERILAEQHEPKYLTFVNPSAEKGVWAFARIADELGRRRPDIPILVGRDKGAGQRGHS
jgi:hypothetical protein